MLKRKGFGFVLFVASFCLVVAVIVFYYLNRSDDAESEYSSQAGNNNLGTSDIDIQTPVTVSWNYLGDFPGHENTVLQVRMEEGNYVETWDPGPFTGRNWVGQFVLELKRGQDVISKYDLGLIFQDRMTFSSGGFGIKFDDYNGDGNLDFTIGQYGSSNGKDYALFTIIGEEIKQLIFEKNQNLRFISETDGYYSTTLKKIDTTTFSLKYYDNAVGSWFVNTYQWDGEIFVLAKEEMAK